MEKMNPMTRKHNDYLREIIQLRSVQNEGSKMIVEGKAIVYDEPFLLFEFGETKYYEQIDRGAFTGADLSQAYFKYNHSDVQMVLTRYKNGTLTFEERDDGVYIRAELADTTGGRDLFTLIQRGDIDKMSFAFTVKKQVVEENKENKSVTYRVCELDKIFDVAAVPHPAYQNTDIYARRRGDVEANLARVETLRKRRLDIKAKETKIKRRALENANYKK